MIKYLLYVLRWIVLAVPGALFFNKAKEILGIDNVYVVMVISQGIMGAMVYFLDRIIFTSGAVEIPWEIKPKAVCADCGRVGKCYRVAGSKCCELHDKTNIPDFRCESCAVKKMKNVCD